MDIFIYNIIDLLDLLDFHGFPATAPMRGGCGLRVHGKGHDSSIRDHGPWELLPEIRVRMPFKAWSTARAPPPYITGPGGAGVPPMAGRQDKRSRIRMPVGGEPLPTRVKGFS